MKKRITSILLALCMVLVLLPAPANAEELPKLAVPTDLAWGKDYDADGICSERPGMISWHANDPHQGEYEINYYRLGESEPFSHKIWTDVETGYWSIHSFIEEDVESGDYYYTVQALGDHATYLDSEVATSESWSYTRPDATLGQVTSPQWEWPTARWNAQEGENCYGFEVIFYYCESMDGEFFRVGHKSSSNPNREQFDIENEYILAHGIGYYKFKVRALSGDITQYQNGPWSEMSEAYYLSEAPTPPTPSKTTLTESMFHVDTTPETYDGTAKTKMITSALTEETDYTLSYSNNVNEGTATITIIGKGDYSGTLTYTFEIVQEKQLVFSVVRNSITLIDGNTARPKSTVWPEEATVSWSSSDPTIVEVGSNGTIIGTGEGNAVVTGTANYQGQEKTVSYTVAVKPRVGITLICSEVVAPMPNQKYKLHFGYSPLDATITVSTSDPNVADVTYTPQTGAYIIPKGAGSAVVTVTVKKDGKSKSASCTVTVPETGKEIAQKFVNIALAQKDKTGPQLNEVFGHNDFSDNNWCALFIRACSEKAGVESLFPYELGATAFFTRAIEKGATGVSASNVSIAGATKTNLKQHTPQTGDIIAFSSNGSRITHVGIVSSCDEKNVYVVHGSWHNSHPPIRVCWPECDSSPAIWPRNSLYAQGVYIIGYAHPNWTSIVPEKRGKATIKFHCPVDVRYTYGDEVLDSATGQLEASFGSMVVNDEEKSITVTLNDYYDVDVEITGNGEGTMDLTATFEDEDGTISTRSFQDVPITTDTLGKLYATDSVATAYLELYKNSGENFEEVWTADKNATATEKDAELTAWYTSDNDFGDDEPEPTPTPTPTPAPIPSPSQSSDGGGSSPSTYAIAAPTAEHGKVSLSSKRAERGEKVTVTITPDKGYKLGALTVTDSKKKTVKVTDLGDGKYSFVMPGSKVTIDALFEELVSTVEPSPSPSPAEPVQSPAETAPVSEHFSDVKPTDWFVSAVQYVCDKGMMNGMGTNAFAPGAPASRGMLVTILYRLEGEPEASPPTFSDVADGAYYASAVAWASDRGIVNGFEDGSFRPDGSITREQLSAILYRYAAYRGTDVTDRAELSGYTDATLISSYAQEALSWANAAGLITGTDWGGLYPGGNATRAEVATILMRFCENILKK